MYWGGGLCSGEVGHRCNELVVQGCSGGVGCVMYWEGGP